MNQIPEEHLDKLREHGAVWRFLKPKNGYKAALCYIEENNDVDVIETSNFNLALIEEKELSASIKFQNSISDLLEDQKRFTESLWGGRHISQLLNISRLEHGEVNINPWLNDFHFALGRILKLSYRSNDGNQIRSEWDRILVR